MARFTGATLISGTLVLPPVTMSPHAGSIYASAAGANSARTIQFNPYSMDRQINAVTTGLLPTQVTGSVTFKI